MSRDTTRHVQTGRFGSLSLPAVTPRGVRGRQKCSPASRRRRVGRIRPPPARAEYADRGCTGLYLVVQPSGLKSWALRYRFDGAPRKLALGSFADHEVPGGDALTVAGARKAAAEARHKVEQGMDPAAQKRQAKASAARLAVLRTAGSVEALAEQVLSPYAKPPTRPRPHQQTEDVLRRLVLPAWRGHTVHEVRRRGVIALVEDIAAEHGPHMADKARAVLGKFFAWLVARDVIAASPCL